ncbi:MAG: protein kinase [Polyangiales bacterium]
MRALPVGTGHPFQAGECIQGRFVIEDRAAAGGMGIIYRGRDLQTQRQVAIKVLLQTDATTTRRHANEAEILAALSHPAIVGYIAHGTLPQDACYLVMEWLPGRDVAQRLADTGLRVSEVHNLMRRVCGGLSAAHARGVLHRDLKPSNVFLVDDRVESAKLLDFGVARRDARDTHLTKTGTLIGTVGYMAPEQARGAADLDARSDVFSLGSLLYECLTGQPAFSGLHELATLALVLREEPTPVSVLRPELSPDFDTLLARLMAKDRARRPASANEALAQIEHAFAGEYPDVAASPRRERTSYAEQRILSIVVAAGGVAGVDAHALESLQREFEADVIDLASDVLLLVLTARGDSTASDQAARAARCALRLAELHPGLTLSLATGSIDTSADVPAGATLDRATALLVGEPAGVIKVDALSAGLLGARFELRETALGAYLEREYDDGAGVDVLMGRSTPFVGRAKELAILSAGLRECVDESTARGALVTGAPGAGKSRLGREFVERVRGESRVLFARADLASAGSPLSLIQSLLRNAANLRVGAPRSEQRDGLLAYLRALGEDSLRDGLLELLELSDESPENALHRVARGDTEATREQKRRSFERWLHALCAGGPLLLFLEDLHWGDLPSITFVQDAMRALARCPLFVLATARPELHAQFPLLRERAALEELALQGLTRKASTQLARTMLPGTTPEASIDKVVTLAGGNAFYLEELLRRVAESGTAELPETVVAMAQSRIERLPADARRLLRAASVFGEIAWSGGIDLLLAASDGGLGAWLVEHEILVQRSVSRFPGEVEYAFRHALLREAAYAMLTDADRKTGHTRAGDWLEARGERDARVLADHFERGGAIARAVPWIAKASMTALDSGDLESAIAQSRRGLSLGAYGYQRGMLLLVRSYVSVWKCEPELPGEALSLLPRASAPWWIALALHVFASSILGTQQAAEPYLQLALSTSPGTERNGDYGHAVQVLAAGAALLGRSEVGWALVRHFEEDAAAHASEPDQMYIAWFNLAKSVLAANSLMQGGHWALGEALYWGEASVAAMRSIGSSSGEAAALFHLGNAYWLAGNFPRALSLLRPARELARQIGNVLVEEHAQLLLAVATIRDGARGDAFDTLAALAASTNLQLSHAATTVLADSYYRGGKYEEAIARAEHAASGCSLLYRRTARGVLARALLATGRHREALAATERAFAEGGINAFPHLTVDLLGSRARAQLTTGLIADAENTVQQACRFRDAVASGIHDEESRLAFQQRGRANRVITELNQQLGLGDC